MEIAVCVKAVLDPGSRIQIDAEGRKVEQLEPRTLRMLNPADRTAVTMALRLAGEIPDCRISTVSFDQETCESDIRLCAAMGIPRVVRIQAERIPGNIDALATAGILASYFQEFPVDVIFCGEQSFDENSAIVGPALAEYLEWQFVSSVQTVEWHATSKSIQASVHLGRGVSAEVAVSIPIVLIVGSGNFPYISAKARQRALNEPVKRVEPTLGPDMESRTWVMEYTEPRPRVRRSPVPDSSLSAAERLKILIAGEPSPGGSVASAPQIIESPAQLLAQVFMNFLREKGFFT